MAGKKAKKDRRIHRSTVRVVLIAFVLGIVALDVAFVIGWSTKMDQDEAQASTQAFVTYETETLFGDPFSDKDVKQAKVTAYNVWETTCPACLGEMGTLEKLSKAYPPEEFRLVGACADLYGKRGLKKSQLEKAQKLMKDAGTTFPHLIPTEDMQGFFNNVVVAYPTTYFVDRNGKIIETTCGAKDLKGWKEKVDEVLKKAS